MCSSGDLFVCLLDFQVVNLVEQGIYIYIRVSEVTDKLNFLENFELQ